MPLTKEQTVRVHEELNKNGYLKTVKKMTGNMQRFKDNPTKVMLFAEILDYASEVYTKRMDEKIVKLQNTPDQIDDIFNTQEALKDEPLKKTIECRFCMEDISEEAKVCPYCNSQLQQQRNLNINIPQFNINTLERMNIPELLLSTNGRVNRQKYIISILIFSAINIFVSLLGNLIWMYEINYQGVFGLGDIIGLLVVGYPSLAITIKRILPKSI